jgi:hypothetical protein
MAPTKIPYVNALSPWPYVCPQLTTKPSHIALLECTPLGIPAVQEGGNLFWPSITSLCNEAPYSWSLSGDIHACLSISETTSSSLSTSRTFYAHFVRDTNGVDLWQTQYPLDVRHDWTLSIDPSSVIRSIIQ